MKSRAFALAFLAAAFGMAPTIRARAADGQTFQIEFKDGAVTPDRLEVPANTRLRIKLVNSGTSPAEFESLELHKEKVLAPGVTSVMVIHTLDPGTYDFFDDFHPDAKKAVLVAK